MEVSLAMEKAIRVGISLVVGLAIGFASNAEAREQKFDLNKVNARISFDLPEGWKGETDLFEVPLTLFGPMRDGRRPVINVLPLNLGKDVEFNQKAIKESEKDYRRERRSFVGTHGGKITDFISYKKRPLASGEEAHVIGYGFKAYGTEFTELQYYVKCPKQVFILTSLTRNFKERKASESIATSFKCVR